MRKGLSGGEKKRVSIGYELITDPSLLLLDEPTSGLDSFTSLKIMQNMRTEADRGMTVLATIHQPSSKIFFLFDKIILLSEGYLVYQGPPEKVRNYFSQFGLQMSEFTNPADKISHVSAHPRSCMNPGVTILSLNKACREQQAKYCFLEEKTLSVLTSRLSTRFSFIAE